jgi:hypothetical protein
MDHIHLNEIRYFHNGENINFGLVGRPEDRGRISLRIFVTAYKITRRHNPEDDWIHLAQDRVPWWGLANTLIKLRFP